MYIRNPTWVSVVFLAAIAYAHQHRRSSREMSTAAGLQLKGSDFKTTGQKWSSSEYQTLSSLTSNDPVIRPSISGVPVLNDPSVQDAEKAENVYPVLTTDSSPPLFVTQNGAGGYVRNPYAYVSDGGRGYHVPDQDIDQHPEYTMNNAVPKWNRHYANHRQLKKYGPVIVETDVDLDNGGGYNGYDNGGEYSTIKNYELENNNNYKHNGGSGGEGNQANVDQSSNGVFSWYNQLPTVHWSRPANIETEVRNPGHGMTIDMKKLGLLAMIKLGFIKLKVLMLIKFLLTMAVKLKTMLLFKVKLFFKFFLLNKLLKIIFLPMLPSFLPLLQKLINPMMSMNMNSPMNMMMNGMGSNRLQNDTIESVRRRIITENSGGEPIEPTNLVEFAATIYSAKCIERMACTAAAGSPPSLQSMLINWILSSLVSYIPSKNLNLYMSTFKDVSNSRIENISNPPRSPDELWKWCNEHYPCEDENTDENST